MPKNVGYRGSMSKMRGNYRMGDDSMGRTGKRYGTGSRKFKGNAMMNPLKGSRPMGNPVGNMRQSR